jgi:hypothetical protein
MRTQVFIFLFVSALYGVQGALSQSVSGQSDSLFGPDPLLYNGMIYDYHPPYGTIGTQFLFDKPDTVALVVIRGKTYSRLALNYDVLNQSVVMIYTRPDGGVVPISLSKAWLDQFQVYGRLFHLKTADGEQDKKIYEVTGSGDFKVYKSWSRDLVLKSAAGTTSWAFTTEKAQYYLASPMGLCGFHNQRTFLKCFTVQIQNELKIFMKKEKLRVKDNPAIDWEKLLLFAENYLVL